MLIDKDESLARGEMLDIQNASMYLDSPLISSSTGEEEWGASMRRAPLLVSQSFADTTIRKMSRPSSNNIQLARSVCS